MSVDLRIRGNHVTTEARIASGDADRIAENVAELAKAIAFMIAVGAKGDAKKMNELLEGTSNLMFETAGDFVGLASLMEMVRKARQQ